MKDSGWYFAQILFGLAVGTLIGIGFHLSRIADSLAILAGVPK
jgi:hypothetical protein